MDYDDIIFGAGSCGSALAAAGPDHPVNTKSPDDLLHSWVSIGPHSAIRAANTEDNDSLADDAVSSKPVSVFK
jgi:hypothetical protein